jgi:hypothetical protein
MRSFILIVSLVAGATIVAAQQTAQTNVKETEAIASRSLDTLRQLVNSGNFKNMGFESAEEAAGATLGEPIAVSMVTLEDLRAYQSGADPEKLLKPSDKVIYPVSLKDQVRSSITVQKTNEGWKTTELGRPNLAKLLTSALQRSSAANQVPANAHFAVQIPALNAYFTAYRANGKLMLTSVIDDAGLNLAAGKTLPAEEVFGALAPIAQKYNGLPM